MKKLNVFIILILLTAANLFAKGKVTPFNFSIFPPISLFNKPTVKGIDINSIYGVTKKVYGVQINIIAGKVEEQLYGIGTAIGVSHINELHGIQISWGGKVDKGSGLQISFGNIAFDYFKGIQIGLVGNCASKFQGFQIGIIANVKYTAANTYKPMDEFRGLQIAALNIVKDAGGIQIGVLNYAENLKGIQIGIINIAGNSSIFKVLPIFNASF